MTEHRKAGIFIREDVEEEGLREKLKKWKDNEEEYLHEDIPAKDLIIHLFGKMREEERDRKDTDDQKTGRNTEPETDCRIYREKSQRRGVERIETQTREGEEQDEGRKTCKINLEYTQRKERSKYDEK